MLRTRKYLIISVLPVLLSTFGISRAEAADCSPSATIYKGYTYMAFKSTGACSWSVPKSADVIDYLVVAGGGSGAVRHAGGGGAGGMLTATSVAMANIDSLTITVGAGGSAVLASTNNWASGQTGSDSIIQKLSGSGAFSTVQAKGGGGGQTASDANQSGGSGGGSLTGTSSGTALQGNAGGTGGTNGSTYWSSGGGGGKGGVGGDGSSSSTGAGGTGAIWISDFDTTVATTLGFTLTGMQSGSQVYFAGGGSGGGTSGVTSAANGGLGGGGKGAIGDGATTGGTANSGGGGGGSGCCSTTTVASGAGGSGVVIIRYLASIVMTIPSTIQYRSNSSLTATADVDGQISFYSNGKAIPGCLNKTTISKSATCVWKPSVHGSIQISTVFKSSNGAIVRGRANTMSTTRSSTR